VKTAIKVIVYLAFLAAVYAEEYNVPVMMHIKRARFLADWNLAAYMQRKAMQSYRSYKEEAEQVRG
jgi:hypothetical protein